MKVFVLLLSITLLLSCTNSTKNNTLKGNNVNITTVINQPFEGDFVNDTIFKVNPKEDNLLKTTNGSSIFIPANCIVNKNGDVENGNVNISFNQYHSVLDVISSGIPMNYDTLGEKHTFETAGMFTLKANNTKGEPLKIKENAQIKVNLASDKKDENFNFYHLNEQTGEWTFKENKTEIRENKDYVSKPKIIKPTKCSNKDPFILDFDFDLSNYAELDVFKGIVWEYTGNHDSLNPVKNKISNIKWTDFSLKPTNEKAYEYFLTMRNKRKTFTTKVKAILEGEDFELAMKKFNTSKIDREKKIESLQKPIVRSVNIEGFGTYNYDYIYHIDAPAPIVADFEFDTDSEKEHARIMVLYEDDDVVVSYAKSDWNKFGLNKKSHPKIFAILPNNKIAVFKGNVKQILNKTKYTFRMKTLSSIIHSKVDLLKAIQSI